MFLMVLVLLTLKNKCWRFGTWCEGPLYCNSELFKHILLLVLGVRRLFLAMGFSWGYNNSNSNGCSSACWVLAAPVADRILKCMLVAGEVPRHLLKQSKAAKTKNRSGPCDEDGRDGWKGMEGNNIQIPRPDSMCSVEWQVLNPYFEFWNHLWIIKLSA